MQLSIIFTGIIFSILMISFAQINRNVPVIQICKKYINRSKKNRTFDAYLGRYALLFKKRTNVRSIITSILVVLVLAFIFYNYIFFTVPISDSMKPTFERGDLVLMQTYDTSPNVGDIILFSVLLIGPDEVVTHRIYSISGDSIKTKGDSTPIDQWTITPRQIHAKTVMIGNKPIVLKSVGYYFLDETPTTTFAGEFEALQTILMKAKELGLFIFATCITIFVLLSVNDMKKQKKYRRRN